MRAERRVRSPHPTHAPHAQARYTIRAYVYVGTGRNDDLRGGRGGFKRFRLSVYEEHISLA